ncbi:MAG: RagB/SusD family nutrient uptake outer membrane protein [Bacteroidales bacterium]|nr:RagB/SusD family nutrient uptake outer membrane protein [Bacteroides sp.]MCM1197462.1 RagB/SusD family nutrient uptake outer membrane protein [Clostridium sp.]MCM1502261.1 RagB/SusD family nutrient uptake outer membrane protein [Bacteroidales bacterium]
MKTTNKILLFLAAAATMTGCIKETFPSGSVRTSEQVTSSPSALKAMVDALPASMGTANYKDYLRVYDVHFDCGIPGFHMAYESMLEDIATLGSNVWYNRLHAHGFGRLQGQDDAKVNTHWFWEIYYGYIKSANEIISIINPETITDATMLNYLGIAYANRAMCYLDLARLYEFKENKYTTIDPKLLGLTVPIVTEQTTEEQGKENPRASREDMYKFILSDLENAEKYIDQNATAFNVATLGAVYAMKARAYIEQGYWNDDNSADAFDKAATYARMAIEKSGKTPLTQDQWTDPTNGFNSGSANNSWIWGINTSSENLGNLTAFNAHFSTEATWGYGPLSQIGASKKFYDRISDKDFRKLSWLDPAFIENPSAFPGKYKFAGSDADKKNFLNGTSSNPAAVAYESIKFRPAQGECNDYAVGNVAAHPFIRVEEMYFIEMEAIAHTSVSDAADLLDEFMKNRYTDGSYTCTATGNLELFLEEMLFQKRVEFWGEGILIFDYKRLDKGLEKGYEGTNVPEVLWYNTDGRSPEWNFVLPRGEYQYNHALSKETNNPDFGNSVPLWAGN